MHPFVTCGGERHVRYVKATVEFKKKKRSRVPQADEHEERPEGSRPPARQRKSAAGGVTAALLMVRPPGDRAFFLRNSAEIERVKKTGRRISTPLFNLLACPPTGPSSPEPGTLRDSRIGIVVGKRLGKAVLRNRAKRIFRELARLVRPRLVPGRDLLIFPRREALAVTHQELKGRWLSLLDREKLLRP